MRHSILRSSFNFLICQQTSSSRSLHRNLRRRDDGCQLQPAGRLSPIGRSVYVRLLGPVEPRPPSVYNGKALNRVRVPRTICVPFVREARAAIRVHSIMVAVYGRYDWRYFQVRRNSWRCQITAEVCKVTAPSHAIYIPFWITYFLRRYASKGKSWCGVCDVSLSLVKDYTNSLVVGPTMRPLSDGLYVSREKLAFIVDATCKSQNGSLECIL